MNTPLQVASTDSPTSTGLRAAKRVALDRGISSVTLWRHARRGWIKIVNISGRPYVDLASLATFDARACRGEFAKAPSGAAKKSADERAAKETEAR